LSCVVNTVVFLVSASYLLYLNVPLEPVDPARRKMFAFIVAVTGKKGREERAEKKKR
jgi:hypothetical protein